MKIKRKWTKMRKKEETKVNERERPESPCLVFQEREGEELQKQSTYSPQELFTLDQN